MDSLTICLTEFASLNLHTMAVQWCSRCTDEATQTPRRVALIPRSGTADLRKSARQCQTVPHGPLYIFRCTMDSALATQRSIMEKQNYNQGSRNGQRELNSHCCAAADNVQAQYHR